MAILFGSAVVDDIAMLVRRVMGNGLPTGVPRQREESPPWVRTEWSSLVLALILLVGGVYAIVSPRSLVRWAAQTLPGRTAPEAAIAKSVVMARLMGVLMIAGGVTALLAWFR
jgi:hypothetical protein